MIAERMATYLGVPMFFVEGIARGASYEYKTYSIPKRNGGVRTIHHPSRRLKGMQRWLLENVLSNLPIHEAARAYRKGFSIYHNAEVHATSAYLLRMDLKDFFPSITENDLRNYIHHHSAFFSEFTKLDVEIFCKLVVRHGVLSIGAPTSPAVSNVLCYELDAKLNTMCVGQGINFTRYADDLFFSTKYRGVLKNIEQQASAVIADLEIPANLKINISKTRHSSKRGRRKVTGVVLGSDERVYVGRAYKRKIRALVHNLENLSGADKAALPGLLAYVIGFDPEFMNSLIRKYGLDRIKAARNIT